MFGFPNGLSIGLMSECPFEIRLLRTFSHRSIKAWVFGELTREFCEAMLFEAEEMEEFDWQWCFFGKPSYYYKQLPEGYKSFSFDDFANFGSRNEKKQRWVKIWQQSKDRKKEIRNEAERQAHSDALAKCSASSCKKSIAAVMQHLAAASSISNL